MGFVLGQKIIDKIRNKNQKEINTFSIGKYSTIVKPAYIDSNCEIGSYTYVGSYSNITKAKIGNYCSIGNNVVIGAGEHDINMISTSSFLYDGDDWYKELTKKNVVIKNDVWIGTQSIIRRGVMIGNGAVIGANSFVNKDVPDFAVVVGSPAQIIKYRFDEELRNRIISTNWWDYDVATAKEILKEAGLKNE